MNGKQDITEHINYVKTLSLEHLEASDDTIAEKDLVILIISSLPEEYNFLITALETIAEDNLTWDYVRDIHESENKTNGSTGESGENELWHQRYGHLGYDNLKRLKKS